MCVFRHLFVLCTAGTTERAFPFPQRIRLDVSFLASYLFAVRLIVGGLVVLNQLHRFEGVMWAWF